VGKRQNFWKKAAAKASMSAKNAGVQICRSCFQASPLGKVGRTAVLAQPVRALCLRKDVL